MNEFVLVFSYIQYFSYKRQKKVCINTQEITLKITYFKILKNMLRYDKMSFMLMTDRI